QAGPRARHEDAHLVRGQPRRPVGARLRRAVRARALPDEGLRDRRHGRRFSEVAGGAGRGRSLRAAESRRSGARPARRSEPAGTARPHAGRKFVSTVPRPLEVPHPGVHAAPTSFWRKYIFSLDHKVIGRQYLFYALFMMIIGGLLAGLVRWQLAWPGRPISF